MSFKYTGTCTVLVLFSFSAMAQERIVDTIRNRTRILHIDKMGRKEMTINHPKELKEDFMEMTTGRSVKKPRYGTFYFDYKFDIPVEVSKIKAIDTISLKGFFVLDTIKMKSLHRERDPLMDTVSADILTNFTEKTLKQFWLAPENTILYQQKNPVTVPALRKRMSQHLVIPRTRYEIVEDSVRRAKMLSR